jgi:hypothetical protein
MRYHGTELNLWYASTRYDWLVNVASNMEDVCSCITKNKITYFCFPKILKINKKKCQMSVKVGIFRDLA